MLAIILAGATPTLADFKLALAKQCPVTAARVNAVRCADFGADEPTEAVCSFRTKGGAWKRVNKTYVAVDGDGWHLIDAPACATK